MGKNAARRKRRNKMWMHRWFTCGSWHGFDFADWCFSRRLFDERDVPLYSDMPSRFRIPKVFRCLR